ncbi:hypothetical protein DYD21_01280 [Rhodohalobacter sp. SW132]|uniref:hypothetical protein n=1 Tax=Rhodohalobacter sp. SW132 TaxID=2293433 RepID=UPI000E21C6BD|nr:hypothetical protein [Rhodohalobacter sp. SW132]REL38609.1 hypothetical protein DYD21_01280 [Rhodohalobacter sp. SW132]
MKYNINTILTGSFFLLVFIGLAVAHFQNKGQDTDTKQDVETESITQPLELSTIMRMLMIDMHTINEGIYTKNFDLIEQGAANINNHPPLSTESRQLVQGTLGERMDVFGSFDQTVHSRADSLREAARSQDMNRVMEHYNVIQQGCVNCHTAFQEEIRRECLKRQLQNRE